MSDANENRNKTHPPDRRARKRSSGGDVGHALRKVYDNTLDEEVPASMLDLLGKLD